MLLIRREDMELNSGAGIVLPSQPTRPGVWDISHVKNVTCSGVSAFQLDKMRDPISLPQMSLIMLNIGSVRRKAFVVLCGRVPREQVPCSPSVWQQHRLLYPRYFLMVVIQRELHSMKSEVMISHVTLPVLEAQSLSHSRGRTFFKTPTTRRSLIRSLPSSPTWCGYKDTAEDLMQSRICVRRLMHRSERVECLCIRTTLRPDSGRHPFWNTSSRPIRAPLRTKHKPESSGLVLRFAHMMTSTLPPVRR